MDKKKIFFVFAAAFFLFLMNANAASVEIKDLLRDIMSVPSATGNEELLGAKILSYLPKEAAEKDNLGSIYGRFGQGGPKLAILAPLDEYGWFVSSITPDGYLRLDRSAQPHPNFDGYLLGHPVIISTQKGLLYGVVAQPAMHLLSRERREELRDFSLDLAYVDIGVRSEGDARSKGVEILDPVTLWPDLSVLANDRWAGPSLAQKASAALLLRLADEMTRMKLPQETVLAWMAQTKFPARSGGARSALGALRASRTLQPNKAIIVDGIPADRGEKSPELGKGPVIVLPKEGGLKLKEVVETIAREQKIPLQYPADIESTLLNGLAGAGTDVLMLALPVKFAQTPSEVVDLKDVEALERLLLQLLQSGRVK
jgi:putative aminopeptidase FrvX